MVDCWRVSRANELMVLCMRPGVARDRGEPPQTSAASVLARAENRGSVLRRMSRKARSAGKKLADYYLATGDALGERFGPWLSERRAFSSSTSTGFSKW